jgi:hypothetical protein
MRQQPNYTCMLKILLKLYCIWTWDTLWGFFCFVLFCCVFFFLVFFPLRRQWQNYFWDTISRIVGCGTTTKLLRLKLIAFELGDFFFIYLFFSFYLFNPLCLSNACSAYCWLVHSLSLFISLKLFCLLFVLFFLLVCLFVFPFYFNFLLSISSHLSILNITIVIITN